MVLRSPLYHIQQQLGAKFTEFAGYEMPIQYSSIKDEHLTVRKTVGLFDVSHMSNVWIEGQDAEELLSRTTVEDAARIPDGMSQYTEILREDGTIIDDTIFMHLGDRYMIIPNASMNTLVTNWLTEQAKKYHLKVRVADMSKEYAILAIQGPRSRDTLQSLTDVDLQTVKFFGCREIDIADRKCIISHTGYTGELGFELSITPAPAADTIFTAILKEGKQFGLKPIGLGARDTLRMEKGFMLAGNEFAGGRTPLEATLAWTINWDHDFIGKETLLKLKELGTYQRLTCLKCLDKGIPRHSAEIHHQDAPVGVITSGTVSPCLNTGIALGYVAPDHREKGTVLDIIIRGKPIKAEVVKPPFVPKDWVQHKNDQIFK
ncbi:MAG: glycine cleavage system aminomethyltransferase GcvT [Candidatus Thermoplasmatota archaeon]|nr:glycine cleavage system aminomethyltransferase GcvT [Candidatus Thermoplasmatota archaeon]MBU1941275.1 glycine cleavage system aminomethyltransferase GcvT [Candidatus Thermoplasmatota archaeon]